MGGFGAGLYAAKDAELFSATLLEGAVVPTWSKLLIKQPDTALEMYNNVESNWLPYSLWDVTAANAPAIAATVDYKMVCGDQDGQLSNDQTFANYLLSLGIDPKFQILPGVSHGASMYIHDGTGLAFLNQHFLEAQHFPSLDGDYNHDGRVDAADYSVWRDSLGQTTNYFSGADGNGDGIVDENDYNVWKWHFGETMEGSVAASQNSAVPEPPSYVLCLLIVVGLGLRYLPRVGHARGTIVRADLLTG